MRKEVIEENVVRGVSLFDKLYKYESRSNMDDELHKGVVSSMKDMLGKADAGVVRVATA